MLRNLNQSFTRGRICGTPKTGVLGALVPRTGTNGAGYLAASLTSADDVVEVSGYWEVWPPVGDLKADEDTGFVYIGPNTSGTIRYRRAGMDQGTAVITLNSGGADSTVTSVTVSPSAVTGAATLTATVFGTSGPSQSVIWTASPAGSVSSGGAFTPPAATSSIQTGTITATSVQDPTKSGSATYTIAAIDPSRPPRFARPASDVAAGTWVPSSGSSLFAMIDEVTPDSSDYIKATSAGTAEIALNAVTDPNTSANQFICYQAWSPTGGALTVQLKQGATVIASWVHDTLPTTPTIYERSLTGPQCDAITDYANLRIAFVAA